MTAVDGDPVEALARLVQGAGVDAVAFGHRCADGPACEPGLGHVAEALLERPRGAGAARAPGHAPARGPAGASTSRSRAVRRPPSAMRAADDALCARGREIVMLHVVTGDTPAETGSLPVPRIMDQEHYEWGAWQDEFTMRFSQCPEGGRHRVAVRVGDPAGIIAEEARRERRRADRALVERELRERSRRRDQGAAGHGALPALPRPQRRARRRLRPRSAAGADPAGPVRRTLRDGRGRRAATPFPPTRPWAGQGRVERRARPVQVP